MTARSREISSAIRDMLQSIWEMEGSCMLQPDKRNLLRKCDVSYDPDDTTGTIVLAGGSTKELYLIRKSDIISHGVCSY